RRLVLPLTCNVHRRCRCECSTPGDGARTIHPEAARILRRVSAAACNSLRNHRRQPVHGPAPLRHCGGRGLWRRQRRGVRYRGRDARRGAHAARLCRPAKRPAGPRHRLPDRWDDVARLLLVRADGRPMTEIALGSLFLTLLVLVLTGALILARNRLVPHEAVTVTINRNTRIEASRGDQLLSVLHA